MTTPTPAGWYPDPDGSGGQRYWDGSIWTEHRAPAAPAPPAPEPVASEQPTPVVPLHPAPVADHGGAHRKPDTVPEPEVAQTTEPVTFTPEAPAPSPNRSLITWYGAACAALLAVLVGVAVYGFVIKKAPDVEIASPGAETPVEMADPTDIPGTPPTDSGGWGESPDTATEAPAVPAVPATGDVADGPLAFTVHGTEVGSTVVMSDAPLEKTAVGEYIVVHMTVTNVGPDPATFVAMFQTLQAGGTIYNVDDEATAYLEGTFADLAPGDFADVSIAYDVPVGTPAEAIELHADPSTPGALVTLS